MSADLAIRDEQHYLATVADVRALAERIETVEGAKDLADRARLAQVWAQRAKLGTEQVNLAAAAKLWAERRAGELLTASRESGERATGSGARELQGATLADLGVTKSQSSRWQHLAAIPEADFTKAVARANEEGSVSAARVTRLAEGQVEQRMREAVFPRTPVFDAFWKACDLLIQKARPDYADREEWDAETRDTIRRWAPLMVERIEQLAALVHETRLRSVGGTHADQ